MQLKSSLNLPHTVQILDSTYYAISILQKKLKLTERDTKSHNLPFQTIKGEGEGGELKLWCQTFYKNSNWDDCL